MRKTGTDRHFSVAKGAKGILFSIQKRVFLQSPDNEKVMKNAALYIDMAFCFVLLPLEIYAFPVERWWGTYPLFFGCFILWLYATYFLYSRLIIPWIMRKGRWRKAAVAAILISLTVTFFFSSYEISSPFYHINKYQRENYPVWGIRQNKQAVWIHYILVVIFCFATGMLKEMYRQKLARAEMENERNRAELALYKAQINPHFLFNTLNTIYGLLITGSDKTEASLERFINLTRYMYNNAGREFISLSEEVQYISQYIELQRLRLNEMADVSLTCEVEREGMPVPPMMLITFVENAFKYGISSDDACFIRIKIVQKGDRLLFESANSDFGRKAGSSAGTGIKNCRRRLELMYPYRHSLEIIQDNGVFRVRLEIRES